MVGARESQTHRIGAGTERCSVKDSMRRATVLATLQCLAAASALAATTAAPVASRAAFAEDEMARARKFCRVFVNRDGELETLAREIMLLLEE